MNFPFLDYPSDVFAFYEVFSTSSLFWPNLLSFQYLCQLSIAFILQCRKKNLVCIVLMRRCVQSDGRDGKV